MNASAAVFYGKKDVRIVEREIRLPLDDEIVVKVAFCGICGTDVHIFHGEEGSAETNPPVVLGHEFSGTVHAIGKKITHVAPGDPVMVDPNFYCGVCFYCQSGKCHFCEKMQAVGVTRDGGLQEYCHVPGITAIKVPEMDLALAAFAEPVACCLHGIDRTHIEAGNAVLIIGAGTIGLIMLQLAKYSGAGWLSVIEPDGHKRELALKLGADAVYKNAAECKADKHRTDRVIECVGKIEAIETAIAAASKGAVVTLFGLTPPKAAVSVLPFEIFKKELTITSSFVNPYTQPRALDLLIAGKIDIKPLIEKYIMLDEVPSVLEKAIFNGKVMMKL
jgi:threonine dehydrogenase-like Zn-dependent dehydrogenase